MQAERQEAHRQHDQHGLDQHLDELVDRGRHGRGLVLHLHEFHARGQRAFDARRGALQGFAERDDVAALGHGDAQRDAVLGVVPHQNLGRVDGAAHDVGDVAQANGAPARGGADRHGPQVVHRVEAAVHAHLHHVQRRLHRTSRGHGVLLAELVEHGVEVQPQRGQAFLRDLHVDLLVLHAEELDLGHVVHAQQLLAHRLGHVLAFGVGEALALQRVDHAVHVAEFVVEKGADHALRQFAAHVAHLLSHRVPDVLHLGRWRRIRELEDDQRFTGLGVAADLVGVGHLLQGALDAVDHLLGHLRRGGAGPEHAHHHGPEGERGVLVLPELEVRGDAEQHQHDHEVAREGRVVQRPAREVEARERARLRVGGVLHGRAHCATKRVTF